MIFGRRYRLIGDTYGNAPGDVLVYSGAQWSGNHSRNMCALMQHEARGSTLGGNGRSSMLFDISGRFHVPPEMVGVADPVADLDWALRPWMRPIEEEEEEAE